MTSRLDDAIRDWLDEERAHGGEQAERALARALAGLGRLGPREGFADRVMLAARLLGPVRPGWWAVTGRVALAACVLAAGLALANLPALVAAWGPVARTLGLATMGSAVHWLGRAMGNGFTAWSLVAEIASAMRASLASSAVVLLLAANLLVAAASLAGLRRLLRTSEELLPW